VKPRRRDIRISLEIWSVDTENRIGGGEIREKMRKKPKNEEITILNK
jgi:hypothetical protein